MKRHIDRLRRAIWSYKQPLTHLPFVAEASVSDLFVWRRSAEWETFFELTDLPSLFGGADRVSYSVTLVFFDSDGMAFFEKTIEISSSCRHTLALSGIINGDHGVAGTFAVFHACTPPSLRALGSYLTERGYVSYRFRGAPLRTYVHGNLDAIAQLPDRSLQLLGGQSILRREYNLQYALVPPNSYELFLVNNTSKIQKIYFRTISTNGMSLNAETVELLPRGSHFFRVVPAQTGQRVVIRSRLIMARPLVFQIQDQKMDIFHG